MKPEILDNYRNEHEDTPDARTYDFDWRTWKAGWAKQSNSLKDRDYASLGSALHSLLKWMIDGVDCTKLDADTQVGRRAIALLWTLNPNYFEGVSLTTLANRLGLHKAILAKSDRL